MFKKTINEAETKIAKTNLTNAKEVLNLTREVENQDLWKIYGRDSEAGKMLFKLFGKGHNAVKVDYPKPKTQKKPLPFEDTNNRPKVTPVSKTVIEYPSMANPLIKVPKIHAVDLIPKRKNEVEIRKEIDEFYSKPIVPANKGQNRKEMITELQAKFKKQRGALPKGAELPLAEVGDQNVLAEVNEDEIKQRALQKVPKKHLRFTYEKPKNDQENKKGVTKQEGDEELEVLYNEIEREIEERQSYLGEIMHLDEPKLKERVKKEIVERVAELQKIIGMMRRDE